jgi:protein SCO1/2
MTDSTTSRAGLPLAAVLIVALAAGLGLWAGQRWFASAPADQPQLTRIIPFPEPRPLGEFTLDRGDGSQLDGASLRGHWTLAFLGFTHCPDICPTTLAQLAQVEKALGDLPESDRPRILFISADPERDTPELTEQYARFFSPTAIGVTADHARLEPFARALGMVYMQSPLENGDYSVDHSSSIALIDPQSRMAGLIRPPLDPAAIAADLRSLIQR